MRHEYYIYAWKAGAKIEDIRKTRKIKEDKKRVIFIFALIVFSFLAFFFFCGLPPQKNKKAEKKIF